MNAGQLFLLPWPDQKQTVGTIEDLACACSPQLAFLELELCSNLLCVLVIKNTVYQAPASLTIQ